MNKFTLLSFALCGVSVAFAVPMWEDPAVNSENRLEARSYLPEPGYVMSLSGNWQFAWEGNADGDIARKEPAAIATPFVIDVPSCVETRGWGVPHYTNIRYPHGKTPPKIDPGYNPTMFYRTSFKVPRNWIGRRLVLRFEGVASCAEIWLNNRRVGYFEDARLPSEFDITAIATEDDNELCVKVRKWCDGSYFEDQDMIRYSGIYRDVKLLAERKDGIRDIEITTIPDRDYRVWTVTVKGGDEPKVFTVESPRLWSPEDPHLHEVEIVRNGDVRKVRYGFRECKIENGLILFNGKPIKFFGVNRHEMNPTNGYTVSYAEMERDVKMIKRANFNCVRMSHYPNDPRMYDLCDEYGLLVCAEANVECHGAGYLEDALPNQPMWYRTIEERNVRNVLNYRNHACVAIWSIGNEFGWGEGLTRARDAVKAIDPVRPFHSMGVHNVKGKPRINNFDASDVTSDMYPSIERLLAYANDPKPNWLCEYACAMGNGMGNLREYWDAFYSSDKLSGGCIWDWIDQGFLKQTDRFDAKGRRIEYLAYGGDHDEQPNDGPFCANGLIDAFANMSGKLVEVKHVQQPLEVTCEDAASGEAELWNRYEFSFADDMLDGGWALYEDGEVVERGKLTVPHLAPRAKGKIALPRPGTEIKPGREYFYRVAFCRKHDAKWAQRGFEQAWNQLPFGKRPELAPKGDGNERYEVEETADRVVVTSQSVRAEFCRATGTLSELMLGGKLIARDRMGVVHGPQLQVERAFTDSDTWMRCPFIKSGLTQLSHHPYPIKVERGEAVTVTCPVRVTGMKSGGFEYAARWRFLKDGTIRVDNEMAPFGAIVEVPRIGVFMRLDGALEGLEYYGRGPWENMIDRCSGCDIARWRSTVSEQYVSYIRPQDCGGKTDVRWVELRDRKDGRGVRFSAIGEPFIFQALRHTRGDLDSSRHRPGEQTLDRVSEPRHFQPLEPREEVCLSLDCRQTGVGCNNCGPIPLAKYRFKVGRTEWSYLISPVR